MVPMDKAMPYYMLVVGGNASSIPLWEFYKNVGRDFVTEHQLFDGPAPSPRELAYAIIDFMSERTNDGPLVIGTCKYPGHPNVEMLMDLIGFDFYMEWDGKRLIPLVTGVSL